LRIYLSVKNIKFNFIHILTISSLRMKNITTNNHLFSLPNKQPILSNIYFCLSKQIHEDLKEIINYLRLISSKIRLYIIPNIYPKTHTKSSLFTYITPNNSLNFNLGIMQLTSKFYLINGFHLIYKILNYINPKLLLYIAYTILLLIVIEGLKALKNPSIAFFLINKWLIDT